MSQPQEGNQWKNRIIGTGAEAPDQLLANPKNWRVHPKFQRDVLSGVLDDVGFVDQVIVNKRTGNLVDGHLRVELAIDQDQKEIPVVYVDLTEDEEDLILATFDPITTFAATDQALVNSLVSGIETSNEAIQVLLKELSTDTPTVNEGNSNEDSETPEIENPVTESGDVWLLGKHRLMCGDCRNSEDVLTLLDGKDINVSVTSPPYASQRKYDETTEFKPIPPDEYVDWFHDVQSNIRSNMAVDGSFFINIKEHCEDGTRHLYVKDLTLAHVREWDWNFVDEFIWTHGGTPKAATQRFKNGWEPIFQFTIGRHKFNPASVMHSTDNACARPDWEHNHPCAEKQQGAVKKKQKGSNADIQGTPEGGKAIQDGVNANTNGMAYPSNVLSLGKNREALGHSAAYPVGLPEFFMKAYSDVDDIVYDPFMGSGTTMIAAEKNNRVSMGMEISPSYCDMAIIRWQEYTGNAAILESTGESFNKLEGEK